MNDILYYIKNNLSRRSLLLLEFLNPFYNILQKNTNYLFRKPKNIFKMNHF